MPGTSDGDIVVGFSLSAASAAALRWAAAEGARLGCGVRVLHVYDVREHAEERLESLSGDTVLSRAYELRALDVLDGLEAGSTVVISREEGSVLDVLCRAAADALMLVVGRCEARHHHLDTRLRERVTCPVVAVSAT